MRRRCHVPRPRRLFDLLLMRTPLPKPCACEHGQLIRARAEASLRGRRQVNFRNVSPYVGCCLVGRAAEPDSGGVRGSRRGTHCGRQSPFGVLTFTTVHVLRLYLMPSWLVAIAVGHPGAPLCCPWARCHPPHAGLGSGGRGAEASRREQRLGAPSDMERVTKGRVVLSDRPLFREDEARRVASTGAPRHETGIP